LALGAGLQYLSKQTNGKISWDADERASLGFPAPE
jgi:hypothetical protein